MNGPLHYSKGVRKTTLPKGVIKPTLLKGVRKPTLNLFNFAKGVRKPTCFFKWINIP